jgi:hypothetical protein
MEPHAPDQTWEKGIKEIFNPREFSLDPTRQISKQVPVLNIVTNGLEMFNERADFYRQALTFQSFRKLAMASGYDEAVANTIAIKHTNDTLNLRADNRPTLWFSAGEFGNAEFQFKSFLWNQLRALIDAGRASKGTIAEIENPRWVAGGTEPKMIEVDYKTHKPLLTMLTASTAVGGMGAIPVIGALTEWADYIAEKQGWADTDIKTATANALRAGVKSAGGSEEMADAFYNTLKFGFFGWGTGMNFAETGALMFPTPEKGLAEMALPVSWQIGYDRFIKKPSELGASRTPAHDTWRIISPNSLGRFGDLLEMEQNDWKVYDKGGALLEDLGQSSDWWSRVRVGLSGFRSIKEEAYQRAAADKRVTDRYGEIYKDATKNIVDKMVAREPLEIEDLNVMRTVPGVGQRILAEWIKRQIPKEKMELKSILQDRNPEEAVTRFMVYQNYLGTQALNELEDTGLPAAYEGMGEALNEGEE